ncbi:aspartyl protease [Hydrogenispora ethanolica]|uniref:Aspartyl protease n=1 Tax=Hydrogenispora ethanolica TaxID=1082276 RepID=A0A4R1R9P6_HYDET|nr:aspartyl protease family protein [Hydrogenispora ethanolica]TCL62300.1 aspartyl protease [Hydrogenispora ethanolica]
MARKLRLGIILALFFVGLGAGAVFAADGPLFRIENEKATPIKVPLLWDEKIAIPLVEVKIGAQTLRLALDTGADRVTLALNPAALKRLDVEFLDDRSRSLDVGGQKYVARNFIIPSVKIGALEFTQMKASEELRQTGHSDDGIIGNQLLQEFQVYLDYQASVMVLYPKTSDPECLHSEGWIRMPFDHSNLGIIVPAKFPWSDRPLRFCLDTGAVGNVQGRSMGLIRPEAVPQEQRRNSGAGDYLETSHFYLGESGADLGAMAFYLYDFKQPSVDGFLGHNLLKDHQLLIDFTYNLLYLKRSGDPGEVQPDIRTILSGGRVGGGGDAGTPVVVPFEYRKQTVLLQARINDSPQPYLFLLDTGAGATIVSQAVADALHLEKRAEIKAADGTGASQNVALVTLESLRIGAAEVENCGALVVDLGRVQTDITRVDGIIGGNFLQLFTIGIDYEQQRLTLARSGPVPEAAGYQRVELRKEPLGLIFARLKMAGVADPVEVEIDSGMDGDSYFIFGSEMLEKLRPALGCPPVRSKGTTRGGAFGAAGGTLSRLATAELGGLRLQSVPVEFSGTQSLVGNEFLSHFSVIIDYAGSAMYLRPNERRQMAGNIYSYGFAVNQGTDGTLRIIGLWEGSPAERAGLKLGDEIVGFSDGARELSLAEYRSRFQVAATTAGPLWVRIRNESGERMVELKKAPLLPEG